MYQYFNKIDVLQYYNIYNLYILYLFNNFGDTFSLLNNFIENSCVYCTFKILLIIEL